MKSIAFSLRKSVEIQMHESTITALIGADNCGKPQRDDLMLIGALLTGTILLLGALQASINAAFEALVCY